MKKRKQMPKKSKPRRTQYNVFIGDFNAKTDATAIAAIAAIGRIGNIPANARAGKRRETKRRRA